MDDKQFEEILNQHAELKERRPVKSAGFRVDENSGGEVRWRGKVVDVNEKENPTLNFEIKKLKSVEKVCSLGCGDVVKDQVIEYRLNTVFGIHWRTKCTSCNLYLTPDGQGFIPAHQIHEAYRRHYQDKQNDPE
jgi:hypothetical protein